MSIFKNNSVREGFKTFWSVYNEKQILLIFIYKLGSGKLHLLTEILNFLRNLFLNGTLDFTISNLLILWRRELKPSGI